jgi:protein TonB
MPWLKLTPLNIALTISLVVHALIAALHFSAPKPKLSKDNSQTMEVVFVNTKTKTRPHNADTLAQANLDRGGNTDADRKMKSALPELKNQLTEITATPMAEVQTSPQTNPAGAKATQEQRRVAELEERSQALMTQILSVNTVNTKLTRLAAAPEPTQDTQETPVKTAQPADLMQASLNIARLEAIISRQQDEYQKRPKRKFIGARTQEYRFASYVESWRQKVEKIGNLNYPEAAKNQKLYGQLRMTVSIKSDGSVERIEIDKSSGHAILDNAAKRIVEMSAPYAAFPEDIRKDTDIISITRTWTFSQQDSLSSAE